MAFTTKNGTKRRGSLAGKMLSEKVLSSNNFGKCLSGKFFGINKEVSGKNLEAQNFFVHKYAVFCSWSVIQALK